MAHKNFILTAFAILTAATPALAQDYFDDIYYNPKKDTSSTVESQGNSVRQQKQSNYIANFEDVDVDAYNRRGEQYYVSQIDTIGSVVENGEDFVYTQQIQKYYNPTIVVDNANVLEDVLTNAVGNVEIVINDNGYPVFSPWYGYGWPYYTSVWSPWNWGFNIGPWGWSVGWYDPWYPWGPSWSWGPSWGWGGPAWGPGPGWGFGPGPLATWNPRANRPVGPRPGWSNPPRNPGMNPMNRPGGNFNGGARPSYSTVGAHRVGGVAGSRPSGVVNNGGHWQYNNNNGNSGHRTAGTGFLPGNNNNGSSTNVGNRPNAGNSNKNSVTNRGSSSSSNRNSVSNTQTHRPSVGTSRSTGGARSTGGGGRSTGGRGGGGGGRHR